MNEAKMLENSLTEHPEIVLVLEIAARSREVEARELPLDFTVSTEVAAIPTRAQQCV